MNIFVLKNGQQLGPFTLPELNRQRANGQIQNTDMAWHDEIPDWVPVSQIVGHDPLSPAPAVPPAYGTPVAPPVPGQVPVAARVITALAVFFVSFVVLFCVIYMIACIISGGILAAHSIMAQHGQFTPEDSQAIKKAADTFSQKYIALIAGCSALASLFLSALLAWALSCSSLFPWCRRT